MFKYGTFWAAKFDILQQAREFIISTTVKRDVSELIILTRWRILCHHINLGSVIRLGTITMPGVIYQPRPTIYL